MAGDLRSRSPGSRRLPKRLAVPAFVGLILALLAMLEVGARVLIAYSPVSPLARIVAEYEMLAMRGPDWIRFVPDPELSYALRPGYELRADGRPGVTRHNRDGFRNLRDFAPKPPGVTRIACYGGSTTYGVSVQDNEETYPARLEVALNQIRGADSSRVETWNLGVGGYTTREILGTLKRTLPALQPDAVLIQIAINDVIPRFYPDYQNDYSHFRTPFASLELNAFQRMARRSRAWLALAYGAGWIRPLSLQSQTQRPMPPVDEALAHLDATPPSGFAENLEAAVRLARDAGCQVWLLTEPYLDVPAFAGPTEEARRLEAGYRRGLLEHNALIREIAARTGAGLVDLDQMMPREHAYFSDPIHMTVPGNRVKAELVANAIAADLDRAQDP